MKNRTKEYARLKVRRKAFLETGKCRDCGCNEIIKSNFCTKCYLIRISAKRLGSGKYWKELSTLLEKQNFKCALTDLEISLKDGIELDHIIPISKNGKFELSNVRWVTKEANRMKQDLTDNELKILCNKILQRI